MSTAAFPQAVRGAAASPLAITVADLVTEHGQRVPSFDVHFTLRAPDESEVTRLVIVCPALTGTHRVGEDWWTSLVSPGGVIDLRTDTVLCVGNLGATDGRDPWHGAHTDLAFTIRDQVQLIERVRSALSLPVPALVIGGSLGGMVALELAVQYAGRAQALVLGAPAAQTQWARALNAVQRDALRVGGPADGLRLARAIGVLSYRTPAEFEARWGAERSDRGAGHDGVTYLRAHGERLLARFEAALYQRLIDMMDTHDLARGRETLPAVLRAVGATVTAVALQDDLLYPPAEILRWARTAGATDALIPTVHGHDGFLIHEDAVAQHVARVHPPVEHRDVGRPRF